MKGHLGYRCRVCLPPSEPRNLRYVDGDAINDNRITWDAPASTGSSADIEYIVEFIAPYEEDPQWRPITRADPTSRNYTFFNCRNVVFVRVRARNLCGTSTPSDYLQVNPYTPPIGDTVIAVTSSSSVSVPCWARGVKVWCIGRGGSSPIAECGGGGGGLAWRSWTNNTPVAWSTAIECTIQNNYVGNDAPRTSVTFDGATFFARHAELCGGAGYGGNYDGGENGAPGGSALKPGTQSQDQQYYFYGGGIGGGDPLPPGSSPELVDAGAKIWPGPVAPCLRHPAYNRSGLLEAASIAGLRVTESCAADAAIGSGASKWVTGSSPYGGVTWQYNAAGYGGGGFAGSSAPGGPPLILIKFS